MESNLDELRFKEVISVTDGTRYGYVGDLTFDLDSGQIRSLMVPGQGKYFFGLFGKRDDYVVGWDQVRRFGPDIILVEGEPQVAQRRQKSRKWFA